MSLPDGYDKSAQQMEIVLLESHDGLRTWSEVSRQPVRFHHSAGSFGQARTRDGRFLRCVWSVYSLEPDARPHEILYASDDGGQTWKKQPAFVDPHFAAYPHRLRTLRDGTLVLAVPLAPPFGPGTDRPVRASLRLDTLGEMQMSLFFSFDQGRTWEGPLPIYGGQNVSETDFVELPEGHLLCINNSMFAYPGRQLVYREGRRFTPGFQEQVRSGTVPETVCLTEEGILVGCHRNATYLWSDDLGQTWWPLAGIPDCGLEGYQPWIHCLEDGRIACAGHYGADDPLGGRDQYVMIHSFRLGVRRRTRDTSIGVEREFDERSGECRNAYLLGLSCAGEPLADREVELWYVLRDQPGYDSLGKVPLDERTRAGGRMLTARTDASGQARIALPDLQTDPDIGRAYLHMGDIEPRHFSYQLVARFNADRTDPEYLPAQTPQLEFYAVARERDR
jgi:hypothetical protein